MKPAPLFYIQREGVEAGPYDVVQMAGLLRRKIINAETPTRLEGADAWTPFSWQPQYTVAREMPADAVSTRTATLDEEAAERAAGAVPLPSRESLLKIAGFAVAVLLAFGGAFLLGRTDARVGEVVAILGGALFVLGQVYIMACVLEEDWTTVVLFFCLPLYDIYYYVSNFEKYATWFCLKYFGAAIWAGATLGMGQHL